MSDPGGKLSAKAQSQLGMIPGTAFYSPFPFAGMNVQSSGIAIDDKEFRYLENLFRIGDGKLRAGWDVGSPLYTVPFGKSITSFYAYNIGSVNYFAVFLSDGSAYQVNVSNGVIRQIGSLAVFGQFPACAQWGTLYLLIGNRNTFNDYWIWDGSLLYESGTLAPGLITILATGSNYTTVPTVTTFGGSGSGATYDVTVNAGGVVQIQITNPGTGYEVGDIPQLAFTGGGSDTSAILEAVLQNGAVTAVNITAQGSGYTAATVAFSGGGGSGAAGTVQIGSGVDTITITDPGSGYTGATVAFSGGGGTGATATATVIGGQVVEIDITASGSDYTSAPTVTINGDGTAATATCTVQNGIVTGVTITSPGSGYTTAPGVTITGDGTGATGVAIISSSGVASVSVINPGSGFQYAPQLSFVGGGGTGASGVAVLNPTSIARIDVINGGSDYQDGQVDVLINGYGSSGDPNHGRAGATTNGGAVTAIYLFDAGFGYTTPPSITIIPKKSATGSGATAVSVLTPTSIASVQMSDLGKGYTSAPTVIVQPGANNAAYASLNLMPFGISGNSIETFQSRVWLANPAPAQFNNLPTGGNFAVSAPGSLTDFATSDGGLFFTSADRFLQTKYTGIRQSNGYLYFFGDGSVSVVSNVQTTGNPSTTTFNYQNVDPQIGMSWRDTQADFSRTILFGNETGVYGLYGGAVTKVSGKLDDVFVNAIFPPVANALTPSAAVATIFDVKHYFMLMTLMDPDSGAFRNAMVTWNEREWTISSQTSSLTYIGTQKISSKLFAWGTDGFTLFPLFNQPSTNLIKRMDTKLYGGNAAFMTKNFLDFYIQAQDLSAGQVGVAFTTDLQIGGIAMQNPNYESVPSATIPGGLLQPPNFAAGSNTGFFPSMGVGSGGFPFINLALSLNTQSPDFIIGNIMIAYHNISANQ